MPKNDRGEECTDAQLLEDIKNANLSSFRILVNRHSRRCYLVAYRILQDKEMSEDIVQEIMFKLWKSPDLWQNKEASNNKSASFSTWLYRVVTNAAIDSYRKRKREAAYVSNVSAYHHNSGSAWAYGKSDDDESFAAEILEESYTDDVNLSYANKTERSLEMQRILGLVQEEMTKLPLNQSLSLSLARLDGFSHKEVGEILAISPKAVERNIYRAVQKLKAGLAEVDINIEEIFG